MLARDLQNKKNTFTIINIGPGTIIPDSVDVGASDNAAALGLLSNEIKS